MIVFNNWQISVTGLIARQYDNLSRRIDVEGDLPAGYTWQLLVQSGGNADTILLEATETGAGALLTADNLSKAGEYYIQLRGVLEADGVTRRHTNVVSAYIPESLTGLGTWPEVPTEFAQIEQRCAASMIAAESAAEAAKADADLAAALAAEVAEKAAQTAQDATESTQAKEAAQTAQRLAEEAQSAAEAARTAAAAAQAAAETAATDAAGAKKDAETALKAAQDAAAAAANTLESIQTLYQEMQTLAQGVIQDVNSAGRAAVQSVQSAGDTQVQRVTDEGTAQTANAKAQADAAAQSADRAAQSAQEAAESAAVYDDVVANVNQLKDDLDSITTKTPVSRNLANPAEYITGKLMGSTGDLVDSSISFVMGAIRVVSGEKIYLTLPRAINCFDANGSNIQSLYYVPNTETWSDEYTVPDGVASIVITGYNSRLPYMVNRGTELLPYEAYSDDVEYEVKPSVLPDIPVEKVPDINVDKIIGFREDSILPFVYEPEYTMSKGYMAATGSITETENHKHTSKISVKAGDVISIISPKKAQIRFLCAFDENDNAKYSSGSMNQIYSYTVPDGITSIVLTIENKYERYYKVLITTNRNVSGAKYVSKTELPNNSIAVVKNKIAPKLHDKVSGVVNSETGMKINACCCQNKTIMFRGNISSISDIVIGLGHNGAREIFYKIDSTKVTLYTSASGNPVVEVEHGLAISGYICVTINANDFNAKITMATMSGVFTHETNSWFKNPAEVFVETDSGSVLTDCELIFSPNDICTSIWLFGDSYMSYADNRVLFWLKNLGAKNFCINALPGEASDRAMTDLLYMLDYSTPSTIVWNMGMNDGDKNSAVNANWETCFNLLKAICGEKGIELILYTVPSVPTVDNEYKNAVIRDSGYRYIDAASAVGASASGVWYDGMLSSDGVHPNKTGAIAIAQEMILTVPELLLN